jgi:N-acetylglucosaminyldiphosphoundecaprenol N-acetyl-beta-D-mannosaminyltransferase
VRSGEITGAGQLAPRIRIGRIFIDRLSFDAALARIEGMVEAGRGGAVFTPNVHHVVIAEKLPLFSEAYAIADLCVADGQPLIWASYVVGKPLPEKISGSDLVPRLIERVAQRGWRTYLLGGPPGVAEAAGRVLRKRYGDVVAGIGVPVVPLAPSVVDDGIVDAIARARPELVLVALGAPKQELLIHRIRSRIAPAVALGVGASLNFIAGAQRRAPRWLSRAGLEWLYRLVHEPRLARRYLIEDPAFALILLRSLREAWRDQVD